MPPSVPPARSLARTMRPSARWSSSWAARAAAGGGEEAVADLDALDGLDAHERGGELRVEAAVPVHVRAEARAARRRRAPRRRRRACRRPCGPRRPRPPCAPTSRRRSSAAGRRRGGRRRRAAAAGEPSGTRTGPIATVCDTVRMPSSARNARATAPSATRAAVSRALARSSTGRASSKPYFCMPTRSAWPGRGRVSGAPRPRPSVAGSMGSGLMTSCHFGHSVLPMRSAMGLPRLSPWRTPPEIASSSCSNFMRGTAAVAELAAREVGADGVERDGDTGGKTLEDRDELRAVRLSGSEPTEHAPILPQARQSDRRMTSSTAASSGSAANGSPVDEDAHLQQRLVQQHLEAVHDRAADGEPLRRERRRPRRVRDVEERRAAACSASDAATPRSVPPGKRADDEVGVVEPRELGESATPVTTQSEATAEGDDRRRRPPAGAAARVHGRLPSSAIAASAEAAVAPPPISTPWRTRSQPASPRARTMPPTSVLKPRRAPSAKQHRVRGTRQHGELVDLVEERQHVLLQRHREREAAPRRVARVEEARASPAPSISTAAYSQSSPSRS